MGTTFPLKMSKINLRENISMGAMAFIMLIRMGMMVIPVTKADTSIQLQQNAQASCH
jgi:hypothetical protein